MLLYPFVCWCDDRFTVHMAALKGMFCGALFYGFVISKEDISWKECCHLVLIMGKKKDV